MVTNWIGILNGHNNVHDKVGTVRPSLVNDDLIYMVHSKVHEDRLFTVSSVSMQIPNISRTMPLCEIVWVFRVFYVGCQKYSQKSTNANVLCVLWDLLYSIMGIGMQAD